MGFSKASSSTLALLMPSLHELVHCQATGGGLCRHLPHLRWRRNMANSLLSCIFNCLLEFSSCLLDGLSSQKSSTYLQLNILPSNQLLLVIIFLFWIDPSSVVHPSRSTGPGEGWERVERRFGATSRGHPARSPLTQAGGSTEAHTDIERVSPTVPCPTCYHRTCLLL